MPAPDRSLVSIRTVGLTLFCSAFVGAALGGFFAHADSAGLERVRDLNPFRTAPAEEIVLSEQIGGELHTLYERSVRAGREQVRCLYGERQGEAVRVTRLDTSRVLRSEHGRIHHDPSGCRGDGYLGTVHTHPIVTGRADCRLSPTDRTDFEAPDPPPLKAVLCLPGRLVWSSHRAPDVEHTTSVPDAPGREPTATVFVPGQVTGGR